MDARLLVELWCDTDGLLANLEGLANRMSTCDCDVKLLRELDGRDVVQLLLESNGHGARHPSLQEAAGRGL